MMGAVRDLVHLNDMTKQGLWKNLTFHEVAGATVGILGFGAIGRLVAKKLTGFDCRVLAYDVAPDYEVGDQYHVNFASFEEVMSQSDIIFILVPLLPDT
jgi:D-3-phosphoglycerate dehydrogenase